MPGIDELKLRNWYSPAPGILEKVRVQAQFGQGLRDLEPHRSISLDDHGDVHQLTPRLANLLPLDDCRIAGQRDGRQQADDRQRHQQLQ